MLSVKKAYPFFLLFILLGILCIPASIEATSFNTISIDGTEDFASDEEFSTSSGGYTAYATWDANNLYLGYSGNDIGSGESANKWMVWYIDTDPQCGPNGGSGTNYAAPFNTQNWSLPFNADYFLQVRTDEGFNQLNQWGGASWGGTGYTGSINDNDAANYLELSLPLTDIGSPQTIRIIGYFINDPNLSEWTYANWPDVSLAGGDGYKNFGTFYNWYEFDLAGGISPNAPVNFSPAQNCVIDNISTTWGFLQETGTTGSGQYVPGPGSPPSGDGSANITLDSGSDGWMVGTSAFAGVRLADIDSLSYATYRAVGASTLAPALQFSINYDLSASGATGWQGRLVFEPINQPAATIPDTTWQTWDTINSGNGVWWGSGAPAGCTMGSPCTWNTLLATYPNAGINFSAAQFLAKAGSGWTVPFDGNVDNLAITINGAAYTFDLEPYFPVHNITQNTNHLTIQAGVDNATASDVIEIDPGTYIENVVIDKSLTLRGAGAGTDPVNHTILDGMSLGSTTSGIQLLSNVINVTIEDLTVQNYAMSSSNHAGIAGAGSNDNFTVQRVHALTNTGGRGGVYLNGPVDTVLIDNVTAHDNQGRGIVIWNGHKTNITITNNDVRGSNCCGIELQDGTASGVTMSSNTVVGNSDSGMSAIGLTSGAGPNVIAGNTVTNNGRFGIEIKNPNGTGLDSGDGSIVVEGNNVSLVASASMNVRDHAGIAVFRRSFTSGNPAGYVDIPTGMIIRNNTVSGYQQQNPTATISEGFGIVTEGTNHTITGNTVQNNDIGIQEQGGLHADANYVPNDIGDGNQDYGQSPQYFGRGNAPFACGNIVTPNTLIGNGTDIRNQVASGLGRLVTNTNTSETFCTIQAAINDNDTANGHTIQLEAATYAEEVMVTKNLIINGNSTATTSLNPTQDTGSSGDARGWWLVDTGIDLQLNDMTFDGTGYRVWQAIRQKGEGSLTNVAFTEIKYDPSTSYAGTAVAAFGTGPVNFTNVTMSEIGRIGIQYFGSGVNGSVTDNLTYTGKGIGDFLDYGVEIGGGAQAIIQNSQISGNRGVASSDGSTSACILASTYFGVGTEATLIDSNLADCTTAVFSGYDGTDTTATMMKGNTINNVDYAFTTTGAGNSLTAYANNISNFIDGGLDGAVGTINGRHNWWGTYATQPTGVDNDSWAYLLGAPVSDWGDGTLGSAALTSAGGSGSGVIVSHGRGLVNVPFGKGIDPYASDMCSDYYDIFVLNASGNWTVTIPIDGDSSCDSTWTDGALYQFALSGTSPDVGCTGGNCWNVPAAVSNSGRELLVTLDSSADLQGTPFVAGDNTPDSNDPTAVSLSTLSASMNGMGMITAVILLLLTLTTFVLWRQRNA